MKDIFCFICKAVLPKPKEKKEVQCIVCKVIYNNES
jgi:hypothetical protein